MGCMLISELRVEILFFKFFVGCVILGKLSIFFGFISFVFRMRCLDYISGFLSFRYRIFLLNFFLFGILGCKTGKGEVVLGF